MVGSVNKDFIYPWSPYRCDLIDVADENIHISQMECTLQHVEAAPVHLFCLNSLMKVHI
jgi:hypothetical protein